MDPSLTLEKTKKQTTVWQKEAITAQSLQLRGDGSKNSPIVVDQVTKHSSMFPRRTKPKDKLQEGKGGSRNHNVLVVVVIT